MLLAALIVAGCGVPTTPSPERPSNALNAPPPAPGELWVKVVGDSGACIEGATVYVMLYDTDVAQSTQTGPCDVRDNGGVILKDLTSDVEVTVGAFAPGYLDEEQKAIPKPVATRPMIFTLRPKQRP
jgi:hypothetical protein